MAERLILDIGPSHAGTLLLMIGGMHGNETEGAEALALVAKDLASIKIEPNIRFIALRGNLGAMMQGQRYIQDDMNRLWYPGLTNRLLEEERHPEYREIRDILHILQRLGTKHHQRRFFLDLHCTSAPNGIFMIANSLATAKALTAFLHVPIVLGLHDQLHGTALNFFEGEGFKALAFEGGEIGGEHTISNHEKVIWQTMRYVGAVSYAAKPPHVKTYQYLADFSSNLAPCYQVVYVHKINTGDNFCMEPGFKNFDEILEDQLLATDKHGEVRSPYSGRILMPLYQAKGNDGFFVVQPVEI